MQGMSGLDVLKRINNIIRIPIILMIPDYLPIEPEDARVMGVNVVISKTIDDYDFCELVKYCLEDKVYANKVF